MDKEKIIKLLEQIEFSTGFYGEDCPYCLHSKKDGHDTDCLLDEVFTELTAE